MSKQDLTHFTGDLLFCNPKQQRGIYMATKVFRPRKSLPLIIEAHMDPSLRFGILEQALRTCRRESLQSTIASDSCRAIFLRSFRQAQRAGKNSIASHNSELGPTDTTKSSSPTMPSTMVR